MKLRSLLVALTVVGGGLPVVLAAAPAGSLPSDGTPTQTDIDTTQGGCDNNDSYGCGGWDALRDADGNIVGINSRPFVKHLDVINGGTTTTIIDNVTDDPNPAVQGGSDLITTVTPVNLCGAGQTPSTPPAPPRCYETPNRTQISIGYEDSGGHRDFAQRAASTPTVDADTVFDLTLGLNTLGRSLRWSFLWGEPIYWNVENIGQPTATLHVKFKPVLTPQRDDHNGCSAIPVMLCESATADDTFLEASLLLSLDTSLDPVFTGALFAADHANIGSLEATPASSPQMTYGVSLPTMIGGSQNRANFQAFLSDAAILNYFGATPEVAATNAFRTSAFALQRADTGGSASNGTPTWDRWNAGDNGSNGWLIRIPNIGVSTTTGSLAVQELSPAAVRVRPARFSVKTKGSAPSLQIQRTGSGARTRTKITFSVNSSACVGKRCRLVVNKIESKVATTRTRVGTASATGKPVRSVLNTGPGDLRAKNRVSVMLQVKVNGKWRWVASLTGKVR